ncbi:MAG: hypothetical protein JWQ57_5126 [Mucilaginibacter sp.]|nr:hypothetical protein [Mucilaginibacter sp.]
MRNLIFLLICLLLTASCRKSQIKPKDTKPDDAFAEMDLGPRYEDILLNWGDPKLKFDEDGLNNEKRGIRFTSLAHPIAVDPISYKGVLLVGNYLMAKRKYIHIAEVNRVMVFGKKGMKKEHEDRRPWQGTAINAPALISLSPQPLMISTIQLTNIRSASCLIRNDRELSVTLDRPKIAQLYISDCKIYFGKQYPFLNLYNYRSSPFKNLNDTSTSILLNKRESYISECEIDHRTVDNIDADNILALTVRDCKLTDSSSIKCDSAFRVEMSDVTFKSANGRLKLSAGVRTIPLWLKHVATEQMDLDYSRFKFCFFDKSKYGNINDWYSDVKHMYEGIIASQKRVGNEYGFMNSSIEYMEFEDSQSLLGRMLIPIKHWWNGYGFQKDRVIWASLEVFLVFVVINMIFFEKLLNHYDVGEISNARLRSFERRHRKTAAVHRLILCTIYTGVIFYGLKFDISSLVTHKLQFVILLIFEYTVGLIALAYIANLIISK